MMRSWWKKGEVLPARWTGDPMVFDMDFVAPIEAVLDVVWRIEARGSDKAFVI